MPSKSISPSATTMVFSVKNPVVILYCLSKKFQFETRKTPNFQHFNNPYLAKILIH